jgi:NAD(P)-dependent dehydrogenase (short-subunit alcohol dehydrogenase family)
MNKQLESKVALVTGCGSSGPGWGNGKAIAVRFAREGARVMGCDIRLSAAEETRDIIRSSGGTCEVMAVDVANSTQVKELVDAAISHFDRLDILVNNVGIVEVGGPVEYPEDKWRRSLDVNITSMFLTAKYALPHMERLGAGAIVNIGSVAGIREHRLLHDQGGSARILARPRSAVCPEEYPFQRDYAGSDEHAHDH